MSITFKPTILQTLMGAIAQPLAVATPGLPSPTAGLNAISPPPRVSQPNNPIVTAPDRAFAPRVSGLLSGVAPAAAAASVWTCGRLGRFGKWWNNFWSHADPRETSPNDKTQTISFVYVNDIHARFTPDEDGSNPLARMRGYYEQTLEENPHTLFVDGGDIHEKGDITAQITKGFTTRAAFEAVGFDISVIGNHDFAWSAEEVLAYSRAPNTVMLGSNIKYVGYIPAEYGGVEYHIREVGDVRIGFFGMVSKGYDARDEQTDEDYYPDVLKTRHDYEVRAKELVEELWDKVDLIVMVSHLGIETDRELAKSVDGIDVILSAHSHDAIKEVVNGVPIIQADAYSRLIGRLDIVWNLDKHRIADHSMKLIKNDSSVPTDPTVNDEINSIVRDHMPKDNFAQLERKLGDKEAIASLAGEAALYHLNNLPDGQSMNVDAALVDQKTVWLEKWKPGTITLEQIARTFEVEREPAGTPGFSAFYTIEVTGEELNLLRVAGLWGSRWVYNGEGDPQPDQTYTVALPKKAAWNLEHYLNIPERESKAAGEIWEAVYAYGLHRTAEGRYIDSDKPLPDEDPE